MYLGRFRQGMELPLLCWCRDAHGTPSIPTAAPVAVFRDTTRRVLVKAVPPVDRYILDGLFAYGLFLGSLFTPGRYSIEWHYQVGNFTDYQTDHFVVTTGGHESGAVISMIFFQRPEAAYLVQQLDAGKLVAGRNPVA